MLVTKHNPFQRLIIKPECQSAALYPTLGRAWVLPRHSDTVVSLRNWCSVSFSSFWVSLMMGISALLGHSHVGRLWKKGFLSSASQKHRCIKWRIPQTQSAQRCWAWRMINILTYKFTFFETEAIVQWIGWSYTWPNQVWSTTFQMFPRASPGVISKWGGWSNYWALPAVAQKAREKNHFY